MNYIYNTGYYSNNYNFNNTNYMAKRVWRNDMPQTQKNKIAAANKGKRLSPSTRIKISEAMRKYWEALPYKPTSGI